MTDMVTIHNVSKSYGDLQVLRDVSLQVARGEVVCILGSSGAGKSTLLRCVAHLEPLDSGTISLDGELVGYEQRGDHLLEMRETDLCRQRREIGMVFQHFNLFGHLNALNNITLGPRKVQGISQGDAEAEATRLLAQVDLARFASSYPRQLSGGQQQRVAIARALAMKPKVLLFDEPTSALDPQLVGEVLRVIRDLAHTGITMVVVTHEVRFALEIADRIILMADGQVAFDATAEEFKTTDDPQVVAFMSHADEPTEASASTSEIG